MCKKKHSHTRNSTSARHALVRGRAKSSRTLGAYEREHDFARLTLPLFLCSSFAPRFWIVLARSCGAQATTTSVCKPPCKVMVDTLTKCVCLNKFVPVTKGPNARQVPELFHALAGLVSTCCCSRGYTDEFEFAGGLGFAGASTPASLLAPYPQQPRRSFFSFLFPSFFCSLFVKLTTWKQVRGSNALWLIFSSTCEGKNPKHHRQTALGRLYMMK